MTFIIFTHKDFLPPPSEVPGILFKLKKPPFSEGGFMY